MRSGYVHLEGPRTDLTHDAEPTRRNNKIHQPWYDEGYTFISSEALDNSCIR